MIELMIVVVVVAIITSIAYPNFRGSLTKARRVDAQTALLGFSNAMERYFTENNTYVGSASTGPPGAPINSLYPSETPLDGGTKYYDLLVQSAAVGSYILRAVPKGSQSDDGYLELDQTSARAWDRNNDNDTGDANETSWD